MPVSKKPRKKFSRPSPTRAIEKALYDQLALPSYIALNSIKMRKATESAFHQVAAAVNLGLVLTAPNSAAAAVFMQAAEILKSIASFEQMNDLSDEAFDVLENAVVIFDGFRKAYPASKIKEAVEAVVEVAGIEETQNV